MLEFLQPVYLFGLPLAAIPFLIHLWNRKQRTVVEFSSIQFLEKIEKKALRHIRLREIVLLIIRTLVLIFLIMAVSNPMLKFKNSPLGSTEDNLFIIAVDPSLSMKFSDGDGIVIHSRAVHMADEIIDQLHDYGRIIVVNKTISKGGYERVISAEEFNSHPPRPTNYPWNTRIVDENLNYVLKNHEYENMFIFILSDFQKRNRLDFIPENASVFGIPLMWNAEQNMGIGHVEYFSKPLALRKPVKIKIGLNGSATQFRKDKKIYLRINGKIMAQKSLRSVKDDNPRIEMEFLPLHEGWNRAELFLEPDVFDKDNHYYFTFYIEKNKKLLRIRGENDVFWKTVLRPGERAGYFSMEAVMPDAVPDKLDSVRAVLLPSDFSNPQDILNILNNPDFTGTLFVFPESRIDSAGLAWVLNQTGAGELNRIVAARDSNAYLLFANDWSGDRNKSLARHWYFKNYGIIKKLNADVVLQSENHIPIWIKISSRINKNKLFMFLSNPGPGNSNFFIHPIFLNRLYQFILESGSGWNTSDLILPMEKIEDVKAALSGFRFRWLTAPDGIKIGISQGGIPEEIVQEPGFYHGETENGTVYAALNIDGKELEPDFYTKSQLESQYGMTVVQPNEVKRIKNLLSSAKSLTPFLWWLVLAGIFLEMIIVKWESLKGVIRIDRNTKNS